MDKRTLLDLLADIDEARELAEDEGRKEDFIELYTAQLVIERMYRLYELRGRLK